MNCQQFLDKMQSIQNYLLDFIDINGNVEENFQNLVLLFEKQKIKDNPSELKLLFYLITSISKNHYHGPNFFSKIEQILFFFKEELAKYFSNSEVFNIFKSNKRILLFLIEKSILKIDEYVFKVITSEKYVENKYPHYFMPEIKPFLNEQFISKQKNESIFDQNDFSFEKYNIDPNEKNWFDEIQGELPENFYEKRQKGENDDYICELIRNDLVKEFIVYVSKNNIPLDSAIKSSIFETNSFFIKQQKNKRFLDWGCKRKMASLIEYAAFFGSMQIIRYLQMNNVKLTSALWDYSIYSNNPELIHFLEDNHIIPYKNSYKLILNKSIKCHHNEISKYFYDNLLNDEDKKEFNDSLLPFKYYNFHFIQNEKIDESSLYLLIKHDYLPFVQSIYHNKKIEINKKVTILNYNILI